MGRVFPEDGWDVRATADVADVVYVELNPLPAHCDLVDHLFILRDCGRLTGAGRHVFASPFGEVALLGQQSRRTEGPGGDLAWRALSAPPRFGRQPRLLALHGWMVGVRYDPLLSGPDQLATLAGLAAELDRVVGRGSHLDAIVALLDRGLEAAAAARPAAPGSRQHYAIGAWTRALSQAGPDGAVKVSELAGATMVPARTLQRHIRARTGLSPKRYTALRRFDAALRGVASGEAAFADVAVAAGYCDQSHMTADLGQHAGASPGRLRAFARRQHEDEAVRFFKDATVLDRIRLFISNPAADGENGDRRRRADGSRVV
jgi:methylphosphotriester-DNA--protein-cysteine methyltransferase